MNEHERRLRLGVLMSTMRGIVGAAEAAHADNLTTAQQSDYDAASREFDTLAAGLGLAPVGPTDQALRSISDAVNAADRSLSQPLHEPTRLEPQNDGDASVRRLAPGEVRTLKPSEKLEGVTGRSDAPPGAVGGYIRALVTGNPAHLPDYWRAQSIGIGSAGGFTVPTDLSARLIDRARAASVVNQSGALTVPMDSAELTLARLATGATVAWKSENAAATAGDLTFERVTLRARTLIAYIKSSVELAEDSPNYGDAVERELAQALAIELDRAAMFGTGAANEPLGIANQTGIGTTAIGGALTRYTNIGTAVSSIRAANHDPDFLFLAPRTWGFFDALADTTNQPLLPPASWNQLRKFPTTSVPITQGAGSDTTLIVGRGEEILVGVRTEVAIEASRQASDSTDRAFPQLMVFIRAYLRADVALAHPAAFHTLTGVSS